jgi:predicted nucleic acid-binding Zn ribbon protein
MRELLVDPEFMRLVAKVTAKIEAVRPRRPGERRDRWVRLAAHVVIEAMTVQQLRDAAAQEGPRHECPECGEQARRKHKDAARTLMTVCGPLTIGRSTYVCEECGERFTPLDEELGVEPGSDCTAAMRELTAFLHADMPVESAVEVVEKMLGFPAGPFGSASGGADRRGASDADDGRREPGAEADADADGADDGDGTA